MSRVYEFVSKHERISYDEELKEKYEKLVTSYFRKVAKLSGATEKRISYNKAGIAVSGDVTMVLKLEGGYVYVSHSMDGFFGNKIMARRCSGMKDYTGECNQWLNIDNFKDDSLFIKNLNKIANKGSISPW